MKTTMSLHTKKQVKAASIALSKLGFTVNGVNLDVLTFGGAKYNLHFEFDFTGMSHDAQLAKMDDAREIHYLLVEMPFGGDQSGALLIQQLESKKRADKTCA